MNSVVIGILVAVVLLIFFVILIYNGIIRLIQNIKDNDAEIDIQLDRREKIFKNMLAVVKKYMDYEKSTLKEVIAMRSNITPNTSKDEKMNIENKISSLIPSMNLQFEAYPELKANTNMLTFQEEIANTENKLAYSKSAFNESVKELNTKRLSFPANLIVNMFTSLQEKFIFWKLNKEDKKMKENFSVKF